MGRYLGQDVRDTLVHLADNI